LGYFARPAPRDCKVVVDKALLDEFIQAYSIQAHCNSCPFVKKCEEFYNTGTHLKCKEFILLILTGQKLNGPEED
jgi:hypothetical protein